MIYATRRVSFHTSHYWLALATVATYRCWLGWLGRPFSEFSEFQNEFLRIYAPFYLSRIIDDLPELRWKLGFAEVPLNNHALVLQNKDSLLIEKQNELYFILAAQNINFLRKETK